MPVPENFRAVWDGFARVTGEPDDVRFYEAFALGDSESPAHECFPLELSMIAGILDHDGAHQMGESAIHPSASN